MNHRRMALSVVVSCVALTLAGCGGGGGSDSEPIQLTAAPAPAAATATAPVSTTMSATATPVFRPTVRIERPETGGVFLRVTEHSFNPFAPSAPQETIRDRRAGPAPGTSFVISGPETTLVDGFTGTQLKYGAQLMGTPTVAINGFSFVQVDGGGQIHGGAFKFGNNDRPTTGVTFVHRAFADGKQAPDGTYQLRNTDFIGAERGNAAIYFRDVTGMNFSDAAIDSKSAKLYVMNATLQGAHRMIRAWSGAEIILVNAIVNAPTGRAQVWIQNDQATVKHFNTLWCEGADIPSPSHPKCRRTPWLIAGDLITKEQAAKRVIALSSNPLPAVSPFFRTRIDRIDVQYSRNGGAWTYLKLPNTGSAGSPPIGDLRWRIPLNLGDGSYRFRAFFGANGAQVGEASLVVDESGAVVR